MRMFFYGSYEEEVYRSCKEKITKTNLARDLIVSGIGSDNFALREDVRKFGKSTFSGYRGETKMYNRDVIKLCEEDEEAFLERVKKYFETDVVMKNLKVRKKNDMIAAIMRLIDADESVSNENAAYFKEMANLENFGKFMAETFIFAITRAPKTKEKPSKSAGEYADINTPAVLKKADKPLRCVGKNNVKIASDAPENDCGVELRHNAGNEVGDEDYVEDLGDFINISDVATKCFKDPHNYVKEIEALFAKHTTIYRGNKPKYLYLAGHGGTGRRTYAEYYAWGKFLDGVYKTVWQFTAESEKDAENCAKIFLLKAGVNLPLIADRETTQEAFLDWFRENDKWLLIFCRSNIFIDIKDYLPESGNGDVIISAQYRADNEPVNDNDWLGLDIGVIDIEPFPLPVAMEFILDYIDQDEAELSESELRDLERIVKKAKCIPGKLEEAARYLSANKAGDFKCYLEMLEYWERVYQADLEERFEQYKKAHPEEFPDEFSE